MKTKGLILPDIKQYSSEQQSSLADELETCEETPTAIVFLKDYHKMQQETRAAKRSLNVK